jgi:nucleotide-binding universal stress UspA family protein
MTAAFTHILVPVDFSAHSDRALRYAEMLAARHGAAIELLHVVDDPITTGAWSPDAYLPNLTELLQSIVAQARTRLEELQKAIAARGLGANVWVVSGVASREIVARAETGFDLIVMGTHGRTGLSHAVMGSVAERVVRRAPCPVLTVRDSLSVEETEVVPVTVAVA